MDESQDRQWKHGRYIDKEHNIHSLKEGLSLLHQWNVLERLPQCCNLLLTTILLIQVGMSLINQMR